MKQKYINGLETSTRGRRETEEGWSTAMSWRVCQTTKYQTNQPNMWSDHRHLKTSCSVCRATLLKLYDRNRRAYKFQLPETEIGGAWTTKQNNWTTENWYGFGSGYSATGLDNRTARTFKISALLPATYRIYSDHHSRQEPNTSNLGNWTARPRTD